MDVDRVVFEWPLGGRGNVGPEAGFELFGMVVGVGRNNGGSGEVFKEAESAFVDFQGPAPVFLEKFGFELPPGYTIHDFTRHRRAPFPVFQLLVDFRLYPIRRSWFQDFGTPNPLLICPAVVEVGTTWTFVEVGQTTPRP